jgi:hypothetical protein
MADDHLQIGWAKADLTPEEPVAMRGGIKSTGVMDPITATVLILDSGDVDESGDVVLISCDLQHITDGNRYEADMLGNVRRFLKASLPEVNSKRVIMMATHTHVAPSVQSDPQYDLFASKRIAEAVQRASQNKKPGGISYGLGHAVAGHHRIATYKDGSSHMSGSFQSGSTGNQNFSHLEGFEDHSVHLLYTWDTEKNLTGVLINVACPAQVQRGDQLSADYWHEVREELKKSLGPEVFILPQLSAAGDIATTVMVEKKAERRMMKLRFPQIEDARTARRKQIAVRVSAAVTSILPYVKDSIETNPYVAHEMVKVDLPRGFPKRDTNAPPFPIEIHALRVGDIGMVTNPFELYLDYGIRIKGRSPAIQTFVVQLAGSASYLPTEKAVQAGGYGAIPKTCVVGPAAGDKIVEESLRLLGDLWEE